MRLLACILLIVAVAAAPSSAQEKIKIAGNLTLTYSQKEAMEVGDTEGHILRFTGATGTNISTAEHMFMDNAHATTMSFADLTKGNGPQQGYLSLCQEADTVFAKWQGEVTTTLSAEKTPIITFQGIWFYTRGTGKFVTIAGKGTYKGKFISETEHLVDWEGEYLLKK
jgi:hypothetical protein